MPTTVWGRLLWLSVLIFVYSIGYSTAIDNDTTIDVPEPEERKEPKNVDEGPETPEAENPLAEKSVSNSVIDDEGATQEDNARVSVDVTDNGEERPNVQGKKGEENDNYEITLQKLYEQQSNGGKVDLSSNMIEQLEVEAKKQADKQFPSIFDSKLELPPGSATKSRRKRQLVKNPRSRWEDGIVPYNFDKSTKIISSSHQANIKTVFKYFEENTCLKFPKWTPTLHSEMNLSHSNFLIYGDHSGCWSFVGNLHKKNGQDISPCGGYRSVTAHEIGHALGMPHEQDRADRDRYVEQHPENANPKYKGVFSGGPSTGYTLYHDYDLGSQMHYGTHGFSWNGRPTLSVIDEDRKRLMSSSTGLFSHYDLKVINVGYDCAKKCPKEKQSMKCENDGFIAMTKGVCVCRCVVGMEGPTCSDVKKNPKTVTSWPAGSYGLPMTKDGCPSSGFETGSRHHELEWDTRPENNVAYYVKPSFTSTSMEDQFCMLGDATSRTAKWGSGSYCIYQKTETCPEGFTSGFILYDNVNSKASQNKVNGSVPKGEYNQDTKYYYCCRNDGSASDPIDLPIDKPFHLLRYGSTCQNVRGMKASAYYFLYNTVNEVKTGRTGGMYPAHGKWWGNVYLYYCYYHRLNYDCGGKKVLTTSAPVAYVTSPNFPKNYNNYEECNWLITSPSNSRIHVEMVDMDIEASASHACVDSLELRINMIGQKGSRICGKTRKRSSVSDENRVMLVWRASETTTKRGFKAKLTLIADSDMCYNMKDNGASYRGNVGYTQHYQKCIPWEKAKHCRVNPFATKFMDKGLAGNSFCRNPNDALRPWCYINEFCDMNLCDVCGIENCYDKYNDCPHQMERDKSFCSSDHGFEGCHKSCGFCSRGMSGCKTSPKGLGYTGNIDRTKSGYVCQRWDSEHVHSHSRQISASDMPDKTLDDAANYCRSPSNFPEDTTPWCYTTDEDKRWEYCDVPICAKITTLIGSGNDGGKPCVFPFTYKNKNYTTCTSIDIAAGTDWCATTANYDTDKKWAACIPDQTGTAKPKSCSLPTPKDKTAKLTAADASKTEVAVGESVSLECSYRNHTVKSSLMCLSDGSYEGQNPFCHLRCPVGWVRNEDRCYKLIKTKKFFEYAQADCEALGAPMTSVQTAEENAFLFYLMRSNGLSSMYLGMNDYNKEDKYKWIDGAAVTYTNWQKGEPTQGSEHCAVMTGEGKWNDIYCQWHYPQPFVCKMKFTGDDKPCSDEREDCVAMITRNPDLCQTQTAYATRYCRASCGVCPHLKCRNPGVVPNTKISKTDFYLSAGDHVVYTCNDGYRLKSGNLKRACVNKGQVTGQPPVCSPTAEHEETLGFRRIKRRNVDHDQRVTIYDTKRTNIPRGGVIKAWQVYSRANTDMLVQVWRRPDATEKNKYTLVGSHMIHLREHRVNTVTVPRFEQIEVQKDDLIGWYYPDGAVGLEYDACASDYSAYGYYQTEIDRIDKFYAGMSMTSGNSGACRMYSIAAVLAPGQSAKTTNIASLKYGAKCEASYHSHTCIRAFDGKLSPFDAEWISDGGVGTWISVQFAHSFTLVAFKVMQRHCACGQNKGLKLEFSDGSSQNVMLNARPGKSATDEHAMGWDSHELTPVDSTSVKITVDSVYSTQNNGFIEIEVHAVCRTGFERFRDACYKLDTNTKSLLYWPAASKCRALDAYHTSVEDEAENKYLMELKKKNSVSLIYLGISDSAKDDTWVWDDGMTSSYRNWKEGAPSKGENSYDCASQNSDGTWSDQYCQWYYARPYVCKWTMKNSEAKDTSIRIGNIVKPRGSASWRHNVHIPTSTKNQIPFDGKIDSWIVYSPKDTVIVMQVWRQSPTDKATFTLIGNNFVKLVAGLSNLIHVPEFDKFNVKKGDFIGFYVPDVEPGVRLDKSCSSGDTAEVHYIKLTDGMASMLTPGGTKKSTSTTKCYTFSVAAIVSPEKAYPYLNVADESNGATCDAASSNKSTCGRVMDGKLTPSDGEWKTSGGNQGVGATLSLDFGDKYTVIGAMIMQRLNKQGQSKDLTLSFSDGSTQSVTLANGWGNSDTDGRGYFWNVLPLDKVVTDKVDLSVSSTYSTNENGFIEIKIFAECREGWIRFQDSCYKKYDKTEPFFLEAEQICENMGAHLTSIHSQEENNFIVSLMDSTESSLYIGLTDSRSKALWTWVDASKTDYTNWQSTPTLKTVHDCAEIMKKNGKWSTVYCRWHSKQHFVCKKSYKEIPVGESKYLSMDTMVDNTLIGKNIKGIVHGATLVDGGVSGKALSLDGVSSYVYLGHARDECFGNLHFCAYGYSFTLRLKMEDVAGQNNDYYISNGGEESYHSHGIALYRSGSSLRSKFRTHNKRWEVAADSSKAPAGKWLCVTLTWSKTAGLSMFINGQLVQKDTTTSTVQLWSNTNNDFNIGRAARPAYAYGKALIDELAFWPKILNQDTINQICGECPSGWTKRGEFCYKPYKTKKHFRAATAICTAEGAHVSSVLSEEESRFVFNLIGNVSVWIGLNDLEKEGTFVWPDGSPVTYTNWAKGEPNNFWNNEDCVYMSNAKMEWVDLYCEWHYPQPFVCKKPMKYVKDFV